MTTKLIMNGARGRMGQRILSLALEDPELTVKQVSVQCGFGSDERMRRSFIRQLGVSPQAYRNSFALSE